MSGHSKWSTIKHQKAAKDAKKGAVFTKVVNLITLATSSGGNDPETNFKLRLALEKAKDAGMPKDNIDRAIKKGMGELEDTKIEERIFEAYGPDGIALIISTITDNANRTISEIRNVLTKHDGKMAESGAVMYQFKKRGIIYIEIKKDQKEQGELDAIDTDAEDVNETEAGILKIKTTPSNMENAKKALEKKGYKTKRAEITLVPTNPIKVKDRQKVENLINDLTSLDDVTDISSNLA